MRRQREYHLACDNMSVMARQKNPSQLIALLALNGRSVFETYLKVCEGRKTVHVLREGEINSTRCFLRNQNPGTSFRGDLGGGKKGMIPSTLKWVVIPNGWKVAVVEGGQLYTAEARVREPAGLEYSFLTVNEEGLEEFRKEDCWSTEINEAFKQARRVKDEGSAGRKKCKMESNAGEDDHPISVRHNAKLLLGCQYDNPQKKIMEMVHNQYRDGEFNELDQIKPLVEEWISQSSSFVPNLVAPGSSSFEIPIDKAWNALPSTDNAWNALPSTDNAWNALPSDKSWNPLPSAEILSDHSCMDADQLLEGPLYDLLLFNWSNTNNI
jgi:hypothetical protein